jgi:hypothetical protein
VTPRTVAVILAIFLGVFVTVGALSIQLAGRDGLSGLPEVRGNVPMGNHHTDFRWVKPLLDAGYCVRFHYDENMRTIDRGDGNFSVIADSYYIVDEDLDPPSTSDGPTVTVTVSGTPMGGPTVNWDAMPVRCSRGLD